MTTTSSRFTTTSWSATIAGALRAEVVKMTSSPGILQYFLAAVISSLGVAVLIGAFSRSLTERGRHRIAAEALAPDLLAMGWLRFGLPIMLTMAAVSVSNEYLHRTAPVTYLAIPRRGLVLTAKALWYGGLATLMSVVLVPASFLVGVLVAGREVSSVSEVVRSSGAGFVPIVALATYGLTFLCVGIGAIVRNTALALLTVVGWQLAGEQALRGFPFLEPVLTYLPMNNLWHLLRSENHGAPMTWPLGWSAAYLAVWCTGVFAVGVAVVRRARVA